MTKTFLIADTHFGHRNILNLEKDRWSSFSSIEERDEYIVHQWNSVVSEGDRVYHLGDFAMPRGALRKYLPQLNGRIKLISGNHDETTYSLLKDHVDAVIGAKKIADDVLMTHFPVHPQQIDAGRFKYNVHAHMHEFTVDDSRYYSVSINQLEDCKPIEINDLLNKLRELNGDTG